MTNTTHSMPETAANALIAKAEKNLADLKAELAAQVRNQAVLDRYAYDCGLAAATAGLLRGMQLHDYPGSLPSPGAADLSRVPAYINELQPLAESYGFRIVLVWDGSRVELYKDPEL